MKNRRIVFSSSDPDIGYCARKITLGPESDLVKGFLANGLVGKGYSFQSNQMAVFVEPHIDSGFPDVVLAEFKPGFYDHWPEARNELTGEDLRLLSFLYSRGGADFNVMQMSLRGGSAVLARSLELLVDSGLIDRDRESRCWRPRPIDETYGITRLVAIEAKVCNSENVLEQAALNQWFASESYALTPVMPAGAFAERARRAGVGMVAAMEGKPFRRCIAPRRFRLPSSHASWQFNEWLGRRINIGGIR